MAGRAGLLYAQQHRVLITIDEHLDDALGVAACLPLAPELAAAAGVVPRVAALNRARQRLRVHMGEHQHLAARVIGDDGADQALLVEFRR